MSIVLYMLIEIPVLHHISSVSIVLANDTYAHEHAV